MTKLRMTVTMSLISSMNFFNTVTLSPSLCMESPKATAKNTIDNTAPLSANAPIILDGIAFTTTSKGLVPVEPALALRLLTSTSNSPK